MANMKPSHDIFNKPGDEGSAPAYSEESYPGEQIGGSEHPYGPHDHIHKPGDEGTEPEADANVQGYQVTPPAPLGDFQKGPDVRRTYCPPAKGADPTPEMPGAK